MAQTRNKICFSYSTRDIRRVQQAKTGLENLGYEVFWGLDISSMSRQDWRKQWCEQCNRADYSVNFLSASYVQSSSCASEWNYAAKHATTVLNITLNGRHGRSAISNLLMNEVADIGGQAIRMYLDSGGQSVSLYPTDDIAMKIHNTIATGNNRSNGTQGTSLSTGTTTGSSTGSSTSSSTGSSGLLGHNSGSGTKEDINEDNDNNNCSNSSSNRDLDWNCSACRLLNNANQSTCSACNTQIDINLFKQQKQQKEKSLQANERRREWWKKITARVEAAGNKITKKYWFLWSTSSYVGQMKDGKYHGWGTYTSCCLLGVHKRYVGEFKEGQYHGFGFERTWSGTWINQDGSKQPRIDFTISGVWDGNLLKRLGYGNPCKTINFYAPSLSRKLGDTTDSYTYDFDYKWRRMERWSNTNSAYMRY